MIVERREELVGIADSSSFGEDSDAITVKGNDLGYAYATLRRLRLLREARQPKPPQHFLSVGFWDAIR